MNIVTALLTALLEYLDLVCNFLKGGDLPQMPHPGSAIVHNVQKDIIHSMQNRGYGLYSLG